MSLEAKAKANVFGTVLGALAEELPALSFSVNGTKLQKALVEVYGFSSQLVSGSQLREDLGDAVNYVPGLDQIPVGMFPAFVKTNKRFLKVESQLVIPQLPQYELVRNTASYGSSHTLMFKSALTRECVWEITQQGRFARTAENFGERLTNEFLPTHLIHGVQRLVYDEGYDHESDQPMINRIYFLESDAANIDWRGYFARNNVQLSDFSEGDRLLAKLLWNQAPDVQDYPDFNFFA